MGCGGSTNGKTGNAEVDATLDDLGGVFCNLKISGSDINKIRKAFLKIDLTGGGTIEIAELEVFLKEDSAPFNEKIFMMYDSDRSRELNFPEFLMMAWTFCTLDQDNLCKN